MKLQLTTLAALLALAITAAAQTPAPPQPTPTQPGITEPRPLTTEPRDPANISPSFAVTPENQADLFRQLDLNSDGMVSREEFARLPSLTNTANRDTSPKTGTGSGAVTIPR